MPDLERHPMRAAEARALAAAIDVAADRVLCTTLGRAQAARRLAEVRPATHVACWFLDEFQLRLAASDAAADGGAGGMPSANLELVVAADAPQVAVQLAIVPLSMRGEAELARDILQTAWQRLEVGGTLVAAVDNPRDRWVREQLGAWFGKVRVVAHDDATVYVARKDAAPRKVKDFRCEFAFRDQGRLLRAVTRPGVFSHRHVDPGARQLLAAVDLASDLPSSGTHQRRVLDIGCGAGVVGIALAARDPTIAVHGVDSHARAVECTRAGATLNELPNVTAELNSTGDYGSHQGNASVGFDIAVANPPYYGDFAIARRFLDGAWAALKPAGCVWVVTKSPDWYREAMPAAWEGVEIAESKGYWVVTGHKRLS